jgi:hypothetical protein
MVEAGLPYMTAPYRVFIPPPRGSTFSRAGIRYPAEFLKLVPFWTAVDSWMVIMLKQDKKWVIMNSVWLGHEEGKGFAQCAGLCGDCMRILAATHSTDGAMGTQQRHRATQGT